MSRFSYTALSSGADIQKQATDGIMRYFGWTNIALTNAPHSNTNTGGAILFNMGRRMLLFFDTSGTWLCWYGGAGWSAWQKLSN